jgi:ferritin-like metal-binding protein YciE
MAAETLQDLLVDLIRDTYDAEKQLVKALPRMAKAANSPELSAAFEEHLAVTKEQVTRLEKVFKELDETARGKHCVAMEGLIEEGKEVMEEDHEPALMDAALISAAQKVEHYEIAAYGTAKSWASQLGLTKAADLLNQSLEEESETDENLSKISRRINMTADTAKE